MAASTFRVQGDERIATAGVAINRMGQFNPCQPAKVGEGRLGGLRCAHSGALGVAVVVVIVFGVTIIVRVLVRLLDEEDSFLILAVAGLIAQFGGQATINMAVNTQLFPSKGMTLPLISYGGSSTIALCLGVGFLIAITRRNPFIRREPFSLAQLGLGK